MWKLLTNVVYHHHDINNVFLDEQKDVRKVLGAITYSVDKMTLKNCKRRKQIYSWLLFTTVKHTTRYHTTFMDN